VVVIMVVGLITSTILVVVGNRRRCKCQQLYVVCPCTVVWMSCVCWMEVVADMMNFSTPKSFRKNNDQRNITLS
jgi:hypothetical protein